MRYRLLCEERALARASGERSRGEAAELDRQLAELTQVRSDLGGRASPLVTIRPGPPWLALLPDCPAAGCVQQRAQQRAAGRLSERERRLPSRHPRGVVHPQALASANADHDAAAAMAKQADEECGAPGAGTRLEEGQPDQCCAAWLAESP